MQVCIFVYVLEAVMQSRELLLVERGRVSKSMAGCVEKTIRSLVFREGV